MPKSPEKPLKELWSADYGPSNVRLYCGDALSVLKKMPSGKVQCVVTSPPYWGLRDYGTASWEGGDPACDHLVGPLASDKNTLGGGRGQVGSEYKVQSFGTPFKGDCGKCGAVRLDNQLGLEPTPEQYVENMVAVFREVRRVLRADGTVWLNLGDSYAAGKAGRTDHGTDDATSRLGPHRAGIPGGTQPGPVIQRSAPPGYKPKDLVGIPWRVAFALQADGWYLRSDIIWAKPNPMPESVTDRPTKSHEYLFLLAKSARYFWDADAVREAHQGIVRPNFDGQRGALPKADVPGRTAQRDRAGNNPIGRNLRSVWTIATQPYPGAHFATFPPKLIEPCILAGTSESGCCSKCGAPLRRVVRKTGGSVTDEEGCERDRSVRRNRNGITGSLDGEPAKVETVGWSPTCSCQSETTPCIVMDPFIGSGTTAVCCVKLGRNCWGIDLSEKYLVNNAIPRIGGSVDPVNVDLDELGPPGASNA